jgi:hypothetical protein
MSTNKKAYNTGLSAKTNEDADKNSMAVKTFMMILNGLLVIFVLLWCIYKARYKMPSLVRAYEEQDNPSTDKRLEYDCSKETDVYEERSQNRVIKTMMKSDEFNKAFLEQFETRTAGMKKPSALGGFITKMGEYGKKLNDKLTELGEKAADYKEKASETVFGKKDPDAEPREPGMISKIASGTASIAKGIVINPLTRGVAKGVSSTTNFVARKSVDATLGASDKVIS